MDERGDDAVPFAALLGTYWLEPACDDQCDGAECEQVTDLLPSWTGRAVIVAVTVVAAVVAVMV